MSLELAGALGHTTLTVGQSPGCDWIVRGVGVAPVHFSLHWDGSVLRIADVYGAGGVSVDGAAVGAQWRALGARSRIDFGKATIEIETLSVPPPPGREAVAFALPVQSSPSRHPSSGRPGASVTGKMTLMGVAPVEGLLGQAAPRATAPQDEIGRPRSHMPTLMGISSFPPSGSQESHSPRVSAAADEGVAVEERGTAREQPQSPSKAPPAGATLMGIGVGAEPGRLGRATAGEGDPRGLQAFVVVRSERPEAAPSELPPSSRAVHAAIRSSSATPTGRVPLSESGPREVQAVPETPPPSAVGIRSMGNSETDVPQAVLIDAGSGRPAAPFSPPSESSAYESAPSDRGFPAGSPPGLLESAGPERRFPWRYVGVGLITVVAYGAWLYLLDHL